LRLEHLRYTEASEVRKRAMIAEPVRQAVTLADIHRMENDECIIEVDEGDIIIEERRMTVLHLLLIRLLYDLLKPYATEHKLGEVFMDGMRFRLMGTADGVVLARVPDLSFVRSERIPADLDLDDDFPFAPGLAVEVASPGQATATLLKKASQYLDAGTQEVWLLYPKTKQLHRYRHDADAPQVYGMGDTLDAKPLFEGLRISIDDLFGVSLR
jgi:Uma2 family endonuclease